MEITHLIHILSIRGTEITFMWIPSHCGVFYNEKVDIAAKSGAKNVKNSMQLNIPLCKHEYFSHLKHHKLKEFKRSQELKLK